MEVYKSRDEYNPEPQVSNCFSSKALTQARESIPIWKLFRDENLQNPVVLEQSYANYKWIALGEDIWISMAYRFPLELKLNGLESIEVLRGYCKSLDDAITWITGGNYFAGNVAKKATVIPDEVKFHLACQMNKYLFVLGSNPKIESMFETVKKLSNLIVISDNTTLGADKIVSIEKALRMRGSYPVLIDKELVNNAKSMIQIWDNVWIY